MIVVYHGGGADMNTQVCTASALEPGAGSSAQWSLRQRDAGLGARRRFTIYRVSLRDGSVPRQQEMHSTASKTVVLALDPLRSLFIHPLLRCGRWLT